MGHVAFKFEAKGGQSLTLGGLRNIHTNQRLHTRCVQFVSTRNIRQLTRHHNIRGLAARMFHDHTCRQFNPIRGKHRIDPAFKTVSCIGINLQCAAGIGCAHWIEISRLKKHIHGFLSTARRRPAHDTTDAFNTVRIRNQGHACGECVFFVIQSHQGLATGRLVNAQRITRDLISVKHVQRTVTIISEIVGHIDQERNWAQPNCTQNILQPNRAWAVLHTTDQTTVKDGTLIQRIFIDAHCYRTRELAFNRRIITRL